MPARSCVGFGHAMKATLPFVLLALSAFAPVPAAAQLAAPGADTALFPEAPTLIRLYTDCDEDRWPWGTEETFVPKTAAEIAEGIRTRQALEARWRAWFRERAGDSIRPTPPAEWVWPLTVRGRLLDNFTNPRVGGPHGALDIFVTREGVTVRAPVAGVVVAAGDGWQGGYTRARGFYYEGGGLSRRAGNGVLLFDPFAGAYHYLIHFQPGVLVRAGDVVRAGTPLGRVGHSGNASWPGRGRHLHFAFKVPGSACGTEGVLVSTNPFGLVRDARRRMGVR